MPGYMLCAQLETEATQALPQQGRRMYVEWAEAPYSLPLLPHSSNIPSHTCAPAV